VRVQHFLLFALPFLSSLEGPAQVPAQKPAAKPPAVAAQEAVPAPISKHYPILIIAHGNEPTWSLRLGMKGPERLDRSSYPPIVLEPGEITREDSGSSWTYKAKDVAAGANVAVKLTREPCSDNMSETKYTFSVLVDHAQVGSLKGCGLSSPDKFPEFHKKNQLDQDDDASDKDKDKDKKTVLDPVTNFHSPTAVAYLDATGRVIVSRGEVRKTAAPSGSELALSHDGKMLLYTRSDSKTGSERSVVRYEADTGRAREFAGNNVRQAFWSPDDSKVAYLKFDGKIWQVWTAPVSSPESAVLLFPQNVDALHGWASSNSVLAMDLENAYWVSEDKPPLTVPLKEIYGDAFQVMSSDTIRVCPVNPDLLLVSAFYAKAPAGAPTDAMGLNSTFFLYELRSKRRVVLGPATEFARAAEWSRDGLQIFYTAGAPGKTPLSTNRIFWDGTGEKRSSGGSFLVVGK
jgi:uncharacterized membrane protein